MKISHNKIISVAALLLFCCIDTAKPTVPPHARVEGEESDTKRELQTTYYVSTCGMELKGVFDLPLFFVYAVPALVQAWLAPGNVRAWYLPFAGFSLTSHRTLSAWESEEALLNFVRSGSHARAVANIPRFASSARALRITTDTIPGWDEMLPLWEEDAVFVFGGDGGVERHF